MADALTQVIGIESPPIAITFAAERPESLPAFDEPIPPSMPDGRTGRVPVGYVFCLCAAERTFSTAPENHFNCSVGSPTYGLKRLEEVVGNSDVATLLESGWQTMQMVRRFQW